MVLDSVERAGLDPSRHADKPCSTCGVVKPLTAFAPDRRRRDGKQARCRTCHAAYQKIWKARDPEHYRELRRAEYQRHAPRARAASKAWAEANPERVTAYRKEYSQLPEVKAKHRASSARYREANREAANARSAAWARRNPSKRVDYVNQRRALKLATAVEPIDVLAVAARDGWTCGICHEVIDPVLSYPHHDYRSLDHVVPLSAGGSHTLDNVRIAHWICNVRRGAARGELQHV